MPITYKTTVETLHSTTMSPSLVTTGSLNSISITMNLVVKMGLLVTCAMAGNNYNIIRTYIKLIDVWRTSVEKANVQLIILKRRKELLIKILLIDVLSMLPEIVLQKEFSSRKPKRALYLGMKSKCQLLSTAETATLSLILGFRQNHKYI